MSAVWAVDAIHLKMNAVDRYSTELDYEAHIGKPRTFEEMFFKERSPKIGFVAPVEPYKLNERLSVQQGVFLCSNRLDQEFEATLKETLGPFEGLHFETPQPSFVKMEIHPDARPALLRELERMNINYAALFPGLEGFARSLNTRVQTRGTSDDLVFLYNEDPF